jgi:5-methyltetrahydrofolate--homocysteine methyltransferase
MEEICREMTSRGMRTPLMVGGATTSAVHTAVKLAPLYDHVFYGPDASAAAVMAKKYMMDRETFESEQHKAQEEIRKMYYKYDSTAAGDEKVEKPVTSVFPTDSYLDICPADIPLMEIPSSEVLPYFDWKMFYAIWGVKYGSAVPEAMELIQLRRDAEDEIVMDDFKIMLTARFFQANSEGDDICFVDGDSFEKIPMMRQEGGKGLSLADFVVPKESGRRSPFGMFAISVSKKSKAHVHGCSCPACSNHYEDMIGRTVRMTLAEAASKWLDALLLQGPPPHCFAATAPPSRGWHVLSTTKASNQQTESQIKIIKPAAGYASCPDHTLKGDILKRLGVLKHGDHHHEHDHGCSCGCGGHHEGMGIELTESYAMTPESSICGLIFMHPEACYPEIRRISQKQYDDYMNRRGMDAEKARRFLGHLLK